MPGLTRRRVAFILGSVLVLWIVLVFGRAVATSADAAHRVQQLQEANDRAAAQLAAGERELRVIQTPAYLDLQARAEGQGTPDEHVFTLLSPAPSPRPITPLGSPTQPLAPTPLDAWLQLLQLP
jgi:cell division protein FtsB